MKRLLAIASVAAAFFAALPAAAAFPEKPITLVVGFPAGGAPDLAARLLARKLAARLGQPVVVDNRSGAAGTIAAASVARAEPDGHTLLLALASANTLGPALYQNVRFDPVKSFTPIGQFVRGAFILSVRSELPIADFNGLVDYAKRNPGKLNYGSPGNGSLHHICMEMLKSGAGIDLRHVPYKGSPANWLAMTVGEVDVACDSMTNSATAIRAGKVRPLAVTGDRRMQALPQVPMFRELALPQVGVEFWYGLLAPANMSAATSAALQAALAAVTRDPEFVAYFSAQGIDVVGGSSEELARLIQRETATYSEVVRRVGATID